MGRAVACRAGLEGCRGEPPRGVKAAAIGVLASLKPPGMRSATTQPEVDCQVASVTPWYIVCNVRFEY